MLTREMVELAAAVGERSAARAEIERAEIVLRAAHERHELAKTRVMHAHEALEKAVGAFGWLPDEERIAMLEKTLADEARAHRATRATLSDADELLDWKSSPSAYAPHDDAPIGVALTPTGEAIAAAFAEPSNPSSQIPAALEAAVAGDGEAK